MVGHADDGGIHGLVPEDPLDGGQRHALLRRVVLHELLRSAPYSRSPRATRLTPPASVFMATIPMPALPRRPDGRRHVRLRRAGSRVHVGRYRSHGEIVGGQHHVGLPQFDQVSAASGPC